MGLSSPSSTWLLSSQTRLAQIVYTFGPIRHGVPGEELRVDAVMLASMQFSPFGTAAEILDRLGSGDLEREG